MNYIKVINKLILTITLAIFCLGCSSSLSGSLFKPIADIPADKSVVYLYRPNDDRSTEFTIKYYDKEICILKNGGYFAFFVEEGKVEISSSANFKLFVTGLLQTGSSIDFVFTAERGKYYYVLCQDDGSSGSELSMKLVPENYGIKSIKECRLLDLISK